MVFLLALDPQLHTPAFLHPIIIIFSQHMPIPTQPVLQQYQCYVIYVSESISQKKFIQHQKVLNPQSFSAIILECFDTVGWVSGRASGL